MGGTGRILCVCVLHVGWGAAAVVLAPLDRSRGRSNWWCVHVMMQSGSSGPRDFGALPIYSSLSKPWLASRAPCEW